MSSNRVSKWLKKHVRVWECCCAISRFGFRLLLGLWLEGVEVVLVWDRYCHVPHHYPSSAPSPPHLPLFLLLVFLSLLFIRSPLLLLLLLCTLLLLLLLEFVLPPSPIVLIIQSKTGVTIKLGP